MRKSVKCKHCAIKLNDIYCKQVMDTLNCERTLFIPCKCKIHKCDGIKCNCPSPPYYDEEDD